MRVNMFTRRFTEGSIKKPLRKKRLYEAAAALCGVLVRCFLSCLRAAASGLFFLTCARTALGLSFFRFLRLATASTAGISITSRNHQGDCCDTHSSFHRLTPLFNTNMNCQHSKFADCRCSFHSGFIFFGALLSIRLQGAVFRGRMQSG